MVGDFNSHSQSWGYNQADARGEEIEDWQDDNNLILVNDADDLQLFSTEVGVNAPHQTWPFALRISTEE